MMMNVRGAEVTPLTVHQTIIVLVQGGACPHVSLHYLLVGVRLPVMKAPTNAVVASVHHRKVLLQKDVVPILVVPPLIILKRIDCSQFHLKNDGKLVSSYLPV